MTPHVSTTLLRTQSDERLVKLTAAGHDRAFEAIVDRWTSGYGVDAVVLTAGTASSQPVRQAFRAVRRKGRVVVVE